MLELFFIPSPIVLNFPNTKEAGSGSPNAGIWILLNWVSQLGPFKIISANLAFEDKVNKCHLAVLRVLNARQNLIEKTNPGWDDDHASHMFQTEELGPQQLDAVSHTFPGFAVS